MSQRPYQQAAIGAALEALSRDGSALLVMPTGTGKTIVFAQIAEALRPLGRTLVLAHREELLTQAREKIGAWTRLTTDLEMADARAAVEGGVLPTADVVVASVQSLARPKRLERFRPDEFALIVIDEAHHAVAESYQGILEHFKNAKRLGVTATPDRLDKEALGQVFKVAPYVYEIREAIAEGYLCPIRQKGVHVASVDFSGVKLQHGDLSESQLSEILSREAALHEVAQPLARESAGRKTLVFCVDVAHAEYLGAVLERYVPDPKLVRAVSGRDSKEDRRAALADFASGKVQWLLNCALLTEGYDCPSIDCVATVRPTKSRALYAQMIGRGTRIADGKNDLLVIDFRGSAGRHQLVSAFDMLGGEFTLRTRQLAEQAMASDSELDILGGIDAAHKRIADEYRRDEIEAARLRAQQAAKLAALRAGAVAYKIVDVDPFALLGVQIEKGRWGGAEITAGQRETLERAGLATQGYDRGQAAALLEAVVKRRREGLCTYKQARLLAKYGYNPDVTVDEASAIIDRIAANRWRRPLD